MKKGWRILALFLVLFVLLGSYIYLKSRPAKSDNSQTTNNVVEILKLDATKVKKLTVKTSKGEINLQKNGDKWIVPSVSYSINQSAIEGIVNNIAALEAVNVVENNASDLSRYGLKNPATTVTAVMDNGDEKTVEVGDVVPGGASNYVKLADSNKVYTVTTNTVDAFNISLQDLRQDALATIDSESLTYYKFTKADGKTGEISKTPSDDYTIASTMTLSNYYKYKVGVDADKLKTLAQAISNIKITGYVEDNVKDLSKYGLDKPVFQFTAKDANNTLTILVGKDKDSSSVYFKTAGSNSVYLGDKSAFDSVINTNIFDLYEKFACIVPIDDVDKMEIKTSSGTYNIELTRNAKKAAKQGESDTVVTTYKINGTQVSEDKFKAFYQKVIGINVDSEMEKSVSANPSITIVYTLNKGGQTVKETFSSYDNDFYAVGKNGIQQFVVSKKTVDDIIASIKDVK